MAYAQLLCMMIALILTFWVGLSVVFCLALMATASRSVPRVHGNVSLREYHTETATTANVERSGRQTAPTPSLDTVQEHAT